jgi:D-tyrosyl-tRNA(Tyr) deacylase
MRALIQKVTQARVQVESETVSQIKSGILVFLGIESDDTKEDINWLARKIAHIRLFRPPESKKEESVIDIGGEILIVSQFTLHASTKKGNRPSYIRAARPEQAEALYEKMIVALNSYLPGSVFGGRFGAMMQVELINDGPMTIWIDSKNKE